MSESDRKVKELEEIRQREKLQLQKEHKESLERLRTEQTFRVQYTFTLLAICVLTIATAT